MIDKRAIFKRYNMLKGDTTVYPRFEINRLNKALGLAQRKNKESRYYTTLTSCTCPDHVHRNFFVCKHRLAAMLQTDSWSMDRFLGENPWDNPKEDK
jgi:hypothetical protein